MPALNILLDADGAWKDLTGSGGQPLRDDVSWNRHHTMTFARLPMGTHEGNASIAIRLDMSDGSVIIAETTERLFLAAADAFRARQEYENGRGNN